MERAFDRRRRFNDTLSFIKLKNVMGRDNVFPSKRDNNFQYFRSINEEVQTLVHFYVCIPTLISIRIISDFFS